MLFERKPQLTTLEKKEIALANLKELESKLGKIHVTNTGLITDSHLVTKVSEFIELADKSISIDALAIDFGVNLDAIRSVLQQTKYYTDQSIVYGPRALDNILRLVPEYPAKLVDFCTEKTVTVKLLQHLKPEVVLIGDYVLQRKGFEQFKTQLDKLLESKEPVELPHSPILEPLIAQTKYEGRIDKTTRLFTPAVYYNSQRDALHEKIVDKKFISESEIPFDIKKFAKRYSLLTIPGYVLTQEYLDSQADLVKKEVDNNGVFDTADLELPVASLLSFKYPEPVKGVYVKGSWETKLKTDLCNWAAKNGEEDASELKGITSTSNAKKMANQLSPPNATAIRDEMHELIKYPNLIPAYSQKFTVPIRESYMNSAVAAIETVIKSASDLVTARISAYLMGVTSFEEPLRDALFDEWKTYASENDPAATVVSSISQAVEYFSTDESALVEVVKQMNQANIAKFAKVTDAATVLHLATVIYYSISLSDSKAALKCRGKHIPKILKQKQFPECFSQLKTDVAKKNDTKDSVNAVRAVITGLEN